MTESSIESTFSAERRARTDDLDQLIAAHQELAREAEARKQRADATGAALMTTAITLGAVVIAAAQTISDPTGVSKPAAYVALVSLVLSLVFAGAARAGILRKVPLGENPELPLWRVERRSLAQLDCMACKVLQRDVDFDSADIKETILRVWQAKVEVGRRSVRFKNRLLVFGGACFGVAVTALVVLGFSILGQAWD
jgi:hypothetical protein